MTVTFFGHGDAPQEISADVKTVLKNLIEEDGAQRFYVGNRGNFDRIIARVLSEFCEIYPHITCCIVLEYMPRTTKENELRNLDTILPYEIAAAMPRFAISKRNEWMLENSDLVVTYVWRSFGGAAKYKEMAIRKGKRVIEIAKT